MFLIVRCVFTIGLQIQPNEGVREEQSGMKKLGLHKQIVWNCNNANYFIISNLRFFKGKIVWTALTSA